MTKSRKFLLLAALLAWNPITHATLGEPVSSLDDGDVRAFKAVHKADVTNGNATCHQIVSGRATICEYAEGTGPVYAVTWSGHGHPDLAQLFGTANYQEYLNARTHSPALRGSRQSSFKTANLVINLSGVPRHMSGRACMLKLMPAGVTCGALP